MKKSKLPSPRVISLDAYKFVYKHASILAAESTRENMAKIANTAYVLYERFCLKKVRPHVMWEDLRVQVFARNQEVAILFVLQEHYEVHDLYDYMCWIHPRDDARMHFSGVQTEHPKMHHFAA